LAHELTEHEAHRHLGVHERADVNEHCARPDSPAQPREQVRLARARRPQDDERRGTERVRIAPGVLPDRIDRLLHAAARARVQRSKVDELPSPGIGVKGIEEGGGHETLLVRRRAQDRRVSPGPDGHS
jgi:hypothetical protein